MSVIMSKAKKIRRFNIRAILKNKETRECLLKGACNFLKAIGRYT